MFWYTQFDTLDIPLCNASQSLGATANTSYVEGINGSYNVTPNNIFSRYDKTITATALFTDMSEYEAFLPLVGEKKKLYREDSSSLETWKWATLDSISVSRGTNLQTSVSAQLTFSTDEYRWRGELKSYTQQSTTSVHPIFTPISCANAGDLPVYDIKVVLSISGASSTAVIKELTITSASSEVFEWSPDTVVAGRLDVGESLTIDSAVKSLVHTNGLGAFAYLTSATTENWVKIAAGGTNIVLAATANTWTPGDEATIKITYYEAYA